MGRISFGINATSGSASLSSAVYFLCRHMLYGHCHLLNSLFHFGCPEQADTTPPRVGAASPPDGDWGPRHTLPRTAASAVAMLAGYHVRPRLGSQVV